MVWKDRATELLVSVYAQSCMLAGKWQESPGVSVNMDERGRLQSASRPGSMSGISITGIGDFKLLCSCSTACNSGFLHEPQHVLGDCMHHSIWMSALSGGQALNHLSKLETHGRVTQYPLLSPALDELEGVDCCLAIASQRLESYSRLSLKWPIMQ